MYYRKDWLVGLAELGLVSKYWSTIHHVTISVWSGPHVATRQVDNFEVSRLPTYMYAYIPPIIIPIPSSISSYTSQLSYVVT